MKVLQEDFRVIDNCLCIRMPEEVDHHHAEEICRIADHYILEEQVENVLFDFEDTRFMDSSGIGIRLSSGQTDPQDAGDVRHEENRGNNRIA